MKIAAGLVIGLMSIASVAMAGEKIITRKTLEAQRNLYTVRVLMPCNWLRDRPITLRGEYAGVPEPRMMPYSSVRLTEDEARVALDVGMPDRPGLDVVHILYEDNGQRCPDDFGSVGVTR